MLRFGKLIGVELLWFLGACAVGAMVWIVIASSYNNASDAYWTANGHPPPLGMYRAPWEWRFVITLTPYLLSVVIRTLQAGTRRLRSSTT
jgi:hypothetical protein